MLWQIQNSLFGGGAWSDGCLAFGNDLKEVPSGLRIPTGGGGVPEGPPLDPSRHCLVAYNIRI